MGGHKMAVAGAIAMKARLSSDGEHAGLGWVHCKDSAHSIDT